MKRIMIIAAILVFAGTAVCAASMAISGFNLQSLSSATFKTNRYAVDEDFRGISIQGDTEKITLKPSEDGKCSVICYEEEKEHHNVKVKNGTLTIDKVDTRTWFEHFGFWIESPEITVYLPESKYEKLSIDSDTGEVEIAGAFQFDEINAQLDTGSVYCYASSEKMMEIRTDTGEIVTSDLRAAEASLSSDTGRIHVSRIECKGRLSVNTGTGEADIEDVTCESFHSDGDTGSILLKNVLASSSFDIERDTGNVRFEACDAESIFVKTDTGSVTGTLLSEKIFITETDTGDVSVPKTIAGGKCEITTDTGDIQIEIGG